MITRRSFLSGMASAGVARVVGLPRPAAAEPPPETTRVRMPRYGVDVACTAPQWVAEDLLKAEGFVSVDYLKLPSAMAALARGDLDFITLDVLGLILLLDAGEPVVVLGGVHTGCYQLVGTDRIRSVRDLNGGTVAALNAGRQAFVAAMASYVGLDPRRDVAFVSPPPAEAMQMLADGKIDAFLAFPPEPQELRARGTGRIVVNTATDRPWSQYFCCMVAGHREFVRRHPAATKRVLRALLKATDVCALEPRRVAQFLADRGYVKRQDYALQALQEIPYDRWREYDSADTVRFYALRLHEAGVIKSSPQRILAQGTDWRFLTELKKELKG